ncbi:MAG: hypothetical protein H6567_00635 [Lewinellaceae bacterium]|nr:hypothetical protein [Lewinellaceae bacterium]
MNSKLFYLVCAVLFTIYSCHNDDETFSEVDHTTFTATVVDEIQSTIIGMVFDENNVPVADAAVLTYSTQTKTNEKGIFVIRNARMDKQGTYIKIIKSGYILGSDFVYPQKEAVTYSYTKLLAIEKSKSLNAIDGGIINADGGGEITFAPRSFLSLNGDEYTGKVYVTAKYLNPNALDIGETMPGGLMADAANGNTVILGTLGMMAVDLRDDAGNTVQLNPEKPAELTFPINTTYAPDAIPLWSFDEDKGRWKEEGVATKSGNQYIGKVSHFSFWNCDAPFPIIDVCGRVVNQDGIPLANMEVGISVDGLGTRYGYTNSEGVFCGKMPKDKELKIKIGSQYNCLSGFTNSTVGPFSTNTDLGDIIVLNTNEKLLSGTIVCDGVPVENGIIAIKVGNQNAVFNSKTDGTFKIDLRAVTCEDNFTIDVFGFDDVSSKTSSTLTLTSDSLSNINLNVCEISCDISVNLKLDCLGNLEADVSGGSGNYGYTWANGNTDKIIDTNMDTIDKIYCITVVDIGTGCWKSACKKIEHENGYLEINCQNGEINFRSNVTSGLIFYWPSGLTTSRYKPTSPGTYCVDVTFPSFCTRKYCITYYGQLWVSNRPDVCSKNMFEIPSSGFDFGEIYTNTGSNIPISFPIKVNVFETGYGFVANISSSNCETESDISLPHYNGVLDANVQNTSCPTCDDGKIIVISDGGTGNCYDCTYGAIKIFTTSDFSTDLTSVNDAGMMSKGDYYVVVTDQITGCFIAFRKVTIN